MAISHWNKGTKSIHYRELIINNHSSQLQIRKSTILRELNRNRTKTGCYNARAAHENAQVQKERFSLNRKFTAAMERFIRDKLSNEQWSRSK